MKDITNEILFFIAATIIVVPFVVGLMIILMFLIKLL